MARTKEKNIPFRSIYCILNGVNGKIFQNAIQFGNKLIDCAWDTGEDTNVRDVYIWDIESHPFESINSYTQKARVIESYQKWKVYPTTNFPFLAPIFPAVAVSPKGVVHFINNRDLLFRNIIQDFHLSYRFLTESEFAHREIPLRTLNFLEEICGKGEFEVLRNRNIGLMQSFENAKEY